MTFQILFCLKLIKMILGQWSRRPVRFNCQIQTKPNQTGRDVEFLQKQLIYLGYDLGPDGADGWFGTQTETALKCFQKDSRLPATGSRPSNTLLCVMSSNRQITRIDEPRGVRKKL